jgi:hypothetical protein
MGRRGDLRWRWGVHGTPSEIDPRLLDWTRAAAHHPYAIPVDAHVMTVARS